MTETMASARGPTSSTSHQRSLALNWARPVNNLPQGEGDLAQEVEHVRQALHELEGCGADLRKQGALDLASPRDLLFGDGGSHGQKMSDSLGQTILVDHDLSLIRESEKRDEKSQKAGIPTDKIRLEGEAFRFFFQFVQQDIRRWRVLSEAPVAGKNDLQIPSEPAGFEVPLSRTVIRGHENTY